MHSRYTAGPLPFNPTLYLLLTPEPNTPSKWEWAPTTAQTVTASNVQKRETEAVDRPSKVTRVRNGNVRGLRPEGPRGN